MATTTATPGMTEEEARARLEGAAEDEEFEDAEARELFCALYGREPDAEDREVGVISLCYAAL